METLRPNKGKLGKESAFSDSFKVQVALEYLDGDYSYAQIGKKYDLTRIRVRWFVTWYKAHQVVMEKEPVDPQQIPFSEEDRKTLEKKLMMAEMKIAVLEKVIALANQEYKTDLKKKSATK